jgi:type III secretion protein Q
MHHDSPSRLALRRVNATAFDNPRFMRAYGAELRSDDGILRRLRLSLCERQEAIPYGHGLWVSTCFGDVCWFDCAAFLLAVTGIDIQGPPSSSACAAFAGYAIAALPAPMQRVLGDPVFDRSPREMPAHRQLVATLSYEAPPVTVTMRFAADAQSLAAMLDAGPWCPEPGSVPGWLSGLPSRVRVSAGSVTLPVSDVARLRIGDVIRLPASCFDPAGHGHLLIFDRVAEVRWLDDQLSFEVLSMPTDHPTLASRSDIEPPAQAQDFDMGHLPVRLSFALGSLALPLSEVAAVRQGSLLRLDGGLPPRVSIEANGVPIGYGELVDLEGRLAVEVTQWPRDTAPPAPYRDRS